MHPHLSDLTALAQQALNHGRSPVPLGHAALSFTMPKVFLSVAETPQFYL